MPDERLGMKPEEDIRLVIWDLDDTFWTGTLSEGGAKQIQANHEIVKELSRRGIVNSICSKNDAHEVERMLDAIGMREFFVFPSVDWTAKGPRLKGLLEVFKMRPNSALFIDDHPANRAEALRYVPELQVADQFCIVTLLDDNRLKGSGDPEMSRLSKYKILERRERSRTSATGDTSEFLQQSDIRVLFQYDIETHIDRAVELINRTNQLNFTKNRLSDDSVEAAKALTASLRGYNVKAGLIHVRDNYGDYGISGFYLIEGETLRHFCFSCRLLGMGIENWLFQHLGAPDLTVSSPVSVALDPNQIIDWITIDTGRSQRTGCAQETSITIPEVRVRGGCHLYPFAHYFRQYARKIHLEVNEVSGHLFIRRDCSMTLVPSASDTPDYLLGLKALGYGIEVSDTSLDKPIEDGGVIILSFWGDIGAGHFRWAGTDSLVPNHLLDICEYGAIPTPNDIDQHFAQHAFDEATRTKLLTAIDGIPKFFSYELGITVERASANLDEILSRLPLNARIVILLPAEFSPSEGRIVKIAAAAKHNEAIRQISARYGNVCLLQTDSFIFDESERQTGILHFDRLVYYRMFQAIIDLLGEPHTVTV